MGSVTSTDVVGPTSFTCGLRMPETRWAQQEQKQSQHHPSHHNHRERQVTFPADWTGGTWHWKQTHLCKSHVINMDVSGLNAPMFAHDMIHEVWCGHTYIPEDSLCLCSRTEIGEAEKEREGTMFIEWKGVENKCIPQYCDSHRIYTAHLRERNYT